MKKTFKYYIKLTLALLLLLQVGQVSAQSFVTWTLPAAASSAPLTGTYTGGSVTIANSGTTGTDVLFQPQSSNSYGSLNGATSNEAFTTTGPSSGTSKQLTFTFSSPVNINEFNIGDIQAITTGGLQWNDSFSFQNVTFTSVVAGGTGGATITTSGATTTSSLSNKGSWLTSNAITSFTINYQTTAGLTHRTLYYSMKVTAICNAGTTAPVPSVTTKANVCPATTVSLTSLVEPPTGGVATVKWFTNNTHTGAAVTDATQAPAGTYYAFYYDATNNCYSPASAAVTATVTLCPLNITNTCPSSSVDLANSFTGSIPSGYELTYHSATPATTANMLTSSVITTSGTYYGAYYLPGQDCYTATGRPLVVTITDCCAAKIAPDLTN